MIQDNTTKWKVRKFTDFASNQALPLGFIYQHLSPIVPVGSLPLLGGTYDRSLYADLWSWANENGLVVSEAEWQAMATAQGGSCSKFSDGNGSTTFRVPALKCWIKGASGIEEVGSYLKAGLPNITGGVGSIGHGTNDFPEYGALSHATDGGTGGYSSAGGTYKILLDASRSNSIYGNADTVQPPSIVGMFLIVAFGVAHNIGGADASNVMQVAEQIQTSVSEIKNSLGNLNYAGFPDYSAGIILATTNQNNMVVIPADGVIMPVVTTINGHSTISITIEGTLYNLYQGYSGTDYNHIGNPVLPMRKGQSITLSNIYNVNLMFFPYL